MNAGELRHRVAFDQPITTQDATGDEIVTWYQAFVLWAMVEPLTGRERLLRDQTVGELEVRIRIRWSEQAAEINAKWRARHQGRIYNLSEPRADTTGRRELEFIATAGVDNG